MHAKVPVFAPANQIVRRIYAYSLIPGGVGSASAFGAYRTSDAVLMNHFRDIGAKVFPTSLPRDKWMYASYRMGDGVYWTKQRVLIHAGERLLTDGNSLVRARCGNRLSDAPEKPVQAFQPPGVTTDTYTPEITSLAPPNLIPADAPQFDVPNVPDITGIAPPLAVGDSYAPAPPLDTGSDVFPLPSPGSPDASGPIFFPPPFVPVGGPIAPPFVPVGGPVPPRFAPVGGPVPPGSPYTPPRNAPLIPTPEIGTWALMLLGLVCLVEMYRRGNYRIVFRDAANRNSGR